MGLTEALYHLNLLEALQRDGILRGLVRFSPDLEILESDAAGQLKLVRRFQSYRIARRMAWGVWRRLPGLHERTPAPVVGLSWAADRLISKWLPASDIYHGIMGVSLRSLQRAKSFGAATIVDNTTLHPIACQHELLADCAGAGIRPSQCESLLPRSQIRRQEQEFRISDRIVVYSAAAQRSFEPFPYSHKVCVVHSAVDHRFFVPRSNARDSRIFRVSYVGRIEAAKGVHNLVDAWKRLRLRDAELVLAGRVMPELSAVGDDASTGIRLAGIVSAEQVAALHHESDVFAFPSANEGLSMALLEAMSSGLPAIAIRDTGADDCITEGINGLLVPKRNVEALSEALLWCRDHRDQLRAMGFAARTRIEQQFTFGHYTQRVMQVYRSMAESRT